MLDPVLLRRAEKFGVEYVDPSQRRDMRLDARKERFNRPGFATGIVSSSSRWLAATCLLHTLQLSLLPLAACLAALLPGHGAACRAALVGRAEARAPSLTLLQDLFTKEKQRKRGMPS